MSAILPPATIGILGGGQLGRMTALAARALGYRVHVLDPNPDCAARAVVERVVVAAFDDAAGAAELARECDVITIEIEQIAPAALEAALVHCPVRPGAAVLAVVRNRARQKDWLAAHDIPIGAYAHVRTADELRRAVATLGPTLFVKACEGGFDGRGQARMDSMSDPDELFASLGSREAVAEQGLDLALELSVLVARRESGEMMVYRPAVNHHEQQVLAWSTLPGELPDDVVTGAKGLAVRIAEALELQGILTIEMFLLRDGRLLVNELAPRPHNSYHASELACPTSQFEQLVRAVCNLPLGIAEPMRPAAIVNLFGDVWLRTAPPRFDEALEVDGTRLFLYDKGEPKAGRKMGHLAAIGDTPAEALARVQDAAARL